MGFNNPAMPWRELEARLSGTRGADGRAPGSPSWNAGGDGPAWSRKRQPYQPPPLPSVEDVVPYAELHCHSNYSWLDGASHPEQLAEEAKRLGLEAFALTDHDGFYGVVRFAEAARAVDLPTVFGVEVTLRRGATHRGKVALDEKATARQAALSEGGRPSERQRRLDGWGGPDNGKPDPHGEHLVLLADGPSGYANMSRALSLGHLAGEKGAPRFTLDDLADANSGSRWWALTGCRKGGVVSALLNDGPSAADRELQRLIEAFGRDRVLVELWDHGDPLDEERNDALFELAARHRVACVATNNVHYAEQSQHRLATALAAVRARRGLDGIDPWLPPGDLACLRSGAEQLRRFQRYPGVVEQAAEVGRAAAFDLKLVAPSLPPFPCPDDLSEMGYLRRLTYEGAIHRYGSRSAEEWEQAMATIDHELAVIEQLEYPGYFLVVWDIARYCRESNIFCQGRGSAANSAVCYALGITNVDAVKQKLLFERFLSPERDGPPDIDVDIESDRREEVIQYVYSRYGRHHTAQVANIITYRARSAVRDMARALGFTPGQQDAWSSQVDGWGTVATTAAQRGPDGQPDHGIPAAVLELAREVEDSPRHLGIHSGGMVICDRPVIEVCPVEWARMKERSVLQWDKDDCAATGLVKFDLLGLGMLSALHYIIDFVNEAHGTQLDLATIPQDDPDVYQMLCQADSVGVFQVESRAQMATLPRLKPKEFYDLVVEVALIRPGPIQGGSVHPYIRRANKTEDVTYLHPLMEPCLERTLGVPLFQEQLMQLAIDVAGFSPSEADQLRQAMGAKRSRERMERLKARLFEGMAANDIPRDIAEEVFDKMVAFANYGFPESHAVSFAHLVYVSSWLKYHHPGAFCAGLLNAQPMGFWSPHSLVRDARRHGVVVHTPDLNASAAEASVILDGDSTGGLAVRLGISSVRAVKKELAEVIAAGRPYESMEDLVRRVPSITLRQLEAMALAGVFGCFGLERREALWSAGAASQSRPDRLPGLVVGTAPPRDATTGMARLPGMEPVEEAIADLWATGISPDGHPTHFLRERLDALGVKTATELRSMAGGTKVVVAGVVTHRQRPMTAQGITFMNLEDETGLINVVVSKGCWARHRHVARGSPAMVVSGKLEASEGVYNVVAESLTPMHLEVSTQSRDFR